MSWLLTLGALLGKALTMGLLLLGLMIVSGVLIGFGTLWSAIKFMSDTWILQSIAGAWIALTFQRANADADRQLDELNRTFERRLSATKEILRLIDRRTYASRRYIETVEHEPESIQLERAEYQKVVAEWNSEIKTLQISILIDFRDAYYGLEVDHYFLPKFSELDSLIRKQRLIVQSGKSKSDNISKQTSLILSDISRVSLELMRRMLLVAKRDREVLDRRAPLSHENIEAISHRQLLSALFGGRQ